ncbi:inosine/uridine-preferring nucleoside hydrolase [Lasiosphaeria hispida]|uniref:Inosine/uridine-preferring nucleoside hydrolase n=1 Tax=Lasiosphaeria hispida TaxID=260671 RepID=A0AAJ0HL35_9PEZI|nr:inosine/uridine-preferring nucleoside hydrolase [Lasiosphaeria hispida]
MAPHSIMHHLLTLLTLTLLPRPTTSHKNLIIDTDLFSDVDDAGALMLAATSPTTSHLLAVNVNYPSRYSALAASAILAHYGHPSTPVGVARPLTDATFFDAWSFALGEYASKVAFHFSGGTLPWGRAEDAWDPVGLYRRVLAGAEGGVTVVSIGFLENLSGLLNSTADEHSSLSGPELIAAKVSELVIMGGEYPSGYEYNFWGSNASLAAHVVNNWKGRIVFSGYELGLDVMSGARLMAEGPPGDPIRAAYTYYTYNTSRPSWDLLTVLYAMHGLGDMFEYGNTFGYNRVATDGSNEWVDDDSVRNQHWLRLKVTKDEASAELDRRLLEGAWSVVNKTASIEQDRASSQIPDL